MGLLNLFKKPPLNVTFEGGPGDCAENAIIIRGAPNLCVLLESEASFFTTHFGKRDEGWCLEDRITTRVGGRLYHVVRVRLDFNLLKIVYFDITDTVV